MGMVSPVRSVVAIPPEASQPALASLQAHELYSKRVTRLPAFPKNGVIRITYSQGGNQQNQFVIAPALVSGSEVIMVTDLPIDPSEGRNQRG
jgi:hypothetical protein